jgi:glycerophosphoryl diester phosphodiesterase
VTTPRTGFPYLDEPRERGKVLALAHRGGALHPDHVGFENTMRAFRAATALGYRYLETDVHATEDGQLLAFHDDRLDRVTDQVGLILEHRYDALAAALVGSSEPIPRLSDLLEELPDANVNVDLKAPGAVEPMVDLIRRMAVHERVCVGSFSEQVLRRFRSRLRAELGAGAARVATTAGVLAAGVLAFVPHGDRLTRLLRDPGPVLQVPHVFRGVRVVDGAMIRRAHADGRHVHVWVVDEPAEMEHLIDLGVDGLITDRTDVLKDVLLARGLWEGTT